MVGGLGGEEERVYEVSSGEGATSKKPSGEMMITPYMECQKKRKRVRYGNFGMVS